MSETAAPRLVVTDTLGRRIVNIDKPLFTVGRRSETDLRLPGADISRVHAEISMEEGRCMIRDKQSRFGTFVNGERITETALKHGDSIRFGQSDDCDVTFYIDEEAPSVERSAISAVITTPKTGFATSKQSLRRAIWRKSNEHLRSAHP